MTDIRELNVAIVGCGRMGRRRGLAARACGARVVAVCDLDDGCCQRLAQEFPESHPVRDPRSLDWGDLAAVFVCTPPGARGPVERASIEHQVPFFVEKPIGLD